MEFGKNRAQRRSKGIKTTAIFWVMEKENIEGRENKLLLMKFF